MISSDEELQIALLETNGALVRKFYLTLYSDYEQQGTQATASEEGVRHDGVTCDGCEKSVYGFRYKCIQCPDYDLCKECEAQGLHPEHCMLRMPLPMPYSKNRYIRHFGRRMNKNQHNSTNFTDNSKESFKNCKFDNSRSRHCGGNNFPWTDFLGSFVYDVNNTAKECEKQSQDKSSDPQKEQQQQQQSQQSQFRKISETNIEFLKNIGEQIAQNIGEHITQFLDPLGIDINVPQTKNDNVQNKTEDKTNLPSTSNDDSPATKQTQNQNEKPNESDKSPVKDQTKVNDESNVDLNNSTSEKNMPEPEGWTLLNENDSPPTTSNSSPISSRAPSIAEAPLAKPVNYF